MLIPPPKKVLIEPIDDPDMIGAIIVPDMAKERCDQGIVKYVGPDCKYLSVGDWVLFGGYEGTLVFVEGEGRLILMREVGVKLICGPEEWAHNKISGLWFMDKNGKPIPATYELVASMLREACEKFVRKHIRPSKIAPKHTFQPNEDEVNEEVNMGEE